MSEKIDLVKQIFSFLTVLVGMAFVNVFGILYDSQWLYFSIGIDVLVIGSILGVSFDLLKGFLSSKKSDGGNIDKPTDDKA